MRGGSPLRGLRAVDYFFSSMPLVAPPFFFMRQQEGTSSWKYQGWLNHLYTPARYEYRGKLATTRFERSCLAEYAEVFKTVCVDAAYHAFPSEKYLQALVSQVPSDFQFGFKVTDDAFACVHPA